MSRHLPALDLARAAAVLTLLSLAFPATSRAQVAFFPVVTPFPNGVALSATPVVSHDRRYVRMTLDPQFNALQGFDGFSVPAAVSGGGVGAGGLGGLGGGGGGRFLAGMDGPIERPGSTAALAAAGYGPAIPSSAAAALLSGQAGLARRPRLSALMPMGDAPPPPRATPSRAKKRRHR